MYMYSNPQSSSWWFYQIKEEVQLEMFSFFFFCLILILPLMLLGNQQDFFPMCPSSRTTGGSQTHNLRITRHYNLAKKWGDKCWMNYTHAVFKKVDKINISCQITNTESIFRKSPMLYLSIHYLYVIKLKSSISGMLSYISTFSHPIQIQSNLLPLYM
jgi:hypothetical protein